MKTHSLILALGLSALAVSAGCATETRTDTKTAKAQLGFDRTALEQLPRIDRMAFGDDGVPYFIRGDLGVATGSLATVADAQLSLAAAVDVAAAPFRLSAADFSAVQVHKDIVGMTHVRYQQFHNDLPVLDGEMILHVGHDGRVSSVTNAARAIGEVTASPIVTATDARILAEATVLDGASQAQSADLVYYNGRLSWKVRVFGTTDLVINDVIIDATGGAHLFSYPQVFTARDRVVKDGGGQESIIAIFAGQTVRTEAEGPTGDAAVDAAFDNTGGMYDCYEELFGRDSYDNAGATLNSVVHVTFQGSGNNAAWALNNMLYGDGDGMFFGNLAEGYDVTAHELTHGVISAGPNLTYMNESGALNEGYADIMAAVCESWNDGGVVNNDTWLIGEDIFTPNTPGDALRYMNDPTADAPIFQGSPLESSRDYYDDRYQGSEDNGGVHINSGIANLAFVLLVEGGTHPQGKSDIQVASMDIFKAGEIFLTALDDYMVASTNFAQGRTATEEAALALYGQTEAAKIGLAWAAVGVGDAPQTDSNPPTVAITSPADGATVAPSFGVSVAATDDVGVTSVELYIDGTLVAELATAPYDFTAPGTLTDGPHTVQAIASDGFNEVSTEITVTQSTGDPGGDGDGGDGDGGDGDGGDGDGGGGGGGDSGGCSVDTSSNAPYSGLVLLFGLAFLARRRRQ